MLTAFAALAAPRCCRDLWLLRRASAACASRMSPAVRAHWSSAVAHAIDANSGDDRRNPATLGDPLFRLGGSERRFDDLDGGGGGIVFGAQGDDRAAAMEHIANQLKRGGVHQAVGIDAQARCCRRFRGDGPLRKSSAVRTRSRRIERGLLSPELRFQAGRACRFPGPSSERINSATVRPEAARCRADTRRASPKICRQLQEQLRRFAADLLATSCGVRTSSNS